MSSNFTSKSYSGTVEHLPNCVARFKVSIDKDEVAALKTRASKAINKEVNVPGFRKGKAPDDLIMKQYGKHVDSEFREIAVRAACKEAMESTKVYPLKQDIGIELEKIQPMDDGKVEVTFRYETYPVVPDVKVEEIKITPVDLKKVTESDIEHTLRQIQLYHGHFHEAHDRPIQEEDFVIVDIDVIDEPPFKAYENSRFQVTDKGMPQWARKLVLGKKMGETVEGMSEKDKDSPADFVPRKCRVLIRDVQTAHLPELDDDLARKAGAQNVEDLKKNIEAQQTKQHSDERQMALRNQVKEYLKATYSFDLPASDLKGIEEDCKRLINRDKDQFKTPEDLQAYKEKLFENGKEVLKLAYLIPHVGAQLNLKMPNEQDINNRMIQIITQYYFETGEKIPEESFERIRSNIQRELVHERVLDELIRKNSA